MTASRPRHRTALMLTAVCGVTVARLIFELAFSARAWDPLTVTLYCISAVPVATLLIRPHVLPTWPAVAYLAMGATCLIRAAFASPLSVGACRVDHMFDAVVFGALGCLWLYSASAPTTPTLPSQRDTHPPAPS